MTGSVAEVRITRYWSPGKTFSYLHCFVSMGEIRRRNCSFSWIFFPHFFSSFNCELTFSQAQAWPCLDTRILSPHLKWFCSFPQKAAWAASGTEKVFAPRQHPAGSWAASSAGMQQLMGSRGNGDSVLVNVGECEVLKMRFPFPCPNSTILP